MAIMMKAIGIQRYGGPEVVELGDWPKPAPKKGEVLVRVHAGGVNPLEWKVRDGSVAGFLPASPPFILGGDISGVVEAIGPGVTRHKVGDPVFGQVGLLGGFAEYAVTAQNRLARKPASLSHAEAATLPIPGATAHEALFRQGALQKGERVLIHGGSGGVGTLAIQLAHDAGAYVITTTSAGNAEFVRSLGADEVIDYRTEQFEDRTRDIDLVLDTQGGEVLNRSWSVLKPGGRMITTVPPGGDISSGSGRSAIFAIGKPDDDGANLEHLATLAAEGRLKVHIQQILPLSRCAEALETSKAGHVRGKLAISMVD